MTTIRSILSQYLAGLDMLRQVIASCPDSMWNDSSQKNRFWLLAYHAIFYTHLYAHPSEADFVPWEKSRDDLQFMGPPPWNPEQEFTIGEPYTREEALSYLDLCRARLVEVLPGQDMQAESGFDWLPFSKLELQLYNIRHLMLHTGELAERLWRDGGIEVGWVGKVDLPAGQSRKKS